MNKQQTNQMASLRKKLMAAIAMLLVACIMTVSSTYAWFTLSTAPEVSGISTTIGANGNLEMALGTYATFLGTENPRSYVGSSMAATNQDIVDANITWGNLVDLSDGSYGLDKISLFPSRLNSTGTINRTSPLKFPKYGSDGRVSELSNGTLVGDYDGTSGGFINTPGQTATGVSGIGSASSMSKRAFAVMNNKSAMISYKNAAQNAAMDAIREHAGTLAAIALRYQNMPEAEQATATVSANDVATLKALIAKLNESNNAISESMKSAVLVVLAAANTVEDTKWEIGVGLAEGKNIKQYITLLSDVSGQVGFDANTMLTSLNTYVGEYEAIQKKLDDAKAALPADTAEDQSTTWSAIQTSVRALLNASGIKIGGHTVSEVKDDYKANNMNGAVIKDLFNKMQSNALTFSFSADSGIFADIAKLTGKYTSSMAFPAGTEVEGLDLSMLGAKPVEVESGADDSTKGEFGIMYDVLEPLKAPTTDPNAAVTLTDTYGYIVDLLFRTNATESDLLLQVDGTGRIYGEDGVEDTQGNGSNMTFTINAEYSKEKIDGLANGIRVVFFDNAGKIVGVAVPEANGTVVGDAYKKDLQLREYSVGADGVIAIDAVKTDAKLASLTANVKLGLSALVYLDGDVIDNSHAGTASGLQAMVNLQFSSSAKLTPMENADLMAG